jgi:hypothetical protein
MEYLKGQSDERYSFIPTDENLKKQLEWYASSGDIEKWDWSLNSLYEQIAYGFYEEAKKANIKPNRIYKEPGGLPEAIIRFAQGKHYIYDGWVLSSDNITLGFLNTEIKNIVLKDGSLYQAHTNTTDKQEFTLMIPRKQLHQYLYLKSVDEAYEEFKLICLAAQTYLEGSNPFWLQQKNY